MHTTRIDVRRIAKLFAITALLPLLVGVLIDVVFATSPMATIVLGFLAIPLASVLVLRSTLGEFNRVIDQVAPKLELEQEEISAAGVRSWEGTGLFEDDPQDSGLYLVAEPKPALGSIEASPAVGDSTIADPSPQDPATNG